ncbi:MAG: hypothetical protein FJ288_05365 [Planctomycetes bacterium]|nr:hypothetical protein [Planctomycetota bacterium]
MTGPAIILATLTPMERMAALRSEPHYYDMLLAWDVLGPILLVGVVSGAAVALLRRWAAHSRAGRDFVLTADRLGLTGEERAALARVSRVAGLKRLDSVFTMEAAFNRGVEAFLAGPDVKAMSEAARQRLTGLLASLRQKLGFLERPQVWSERPPGIVAIPAGSTVRVVPSGAPAAIEAVVVQAGKDHVVVEMPDRPETQAGETWRLRFGVAGAAWEFDAVVQDVLPRGVSLHLAGSPRAVNQRRFMRAPTSKPVHLAPYSFVDERGVGRLPEFVEGTLVEIGGPGLKIHSRVQTKAGDRVLVVMTTGSQAQGQGTPGAPGRVIRGMGTVRRSTPFYETVVEMTGLRDDELSELVCETLQAARRTASEADEFASAMEGVQP